MRSVATTKQRVKILYFKHFFKHFVFIEKSDFDIKKVQKKYIDVNVCLDVDCVDKNILRLVVKKSPTGESTHYFFHSQDDKVEVSC
ncbi:hypothetical protein SUT007_08790 [Streptococcus parasuis]|nr:hypothetical protein SUT007_08790 [Streptococcus parasuis]